MNLSNEVAGRFFLRIGLWGALIITRPAFANEADVVIHPSILGATSCSTSGCHGGADEKSLQYTVWSQRDVHSRAYATLTTARSARMAEALGIPDPMTSTQCTTCHAPLQAVKTLAPAELAHNVRVHEGVSCASCHGPGGDWVRSHTRTDFNHEDKVAHGLKDLRNLYERANRCVACHQTIDPVLVEKGRHPRLIFELDGQTASEPRHWREAATYNGAHAWQIGQAVAFREMSTALSRDPASAAELSRWQALLWILQRLEGETGPAATAEGLGTFVLASKPNEAGFNRAAQISDQLAKSSAASAFDPSRALVWLKALASTQADFADRSVDRTVQAYRAERLVLALDRLLTASSAAQRPESTARLDGLFAKAQSIPGFVPDEFGRELTAFLKTLP